MKACGLVSQYARRAHPSYCVLCLSRHVALQGFLFTTGKGDMRMHARSCVCVVMDYAL